jgi:hypothetical protein
LAAAALTLVAGSTRSTASILRHPQTSFSGLSR